MASAQTVARAISLAGFQGNDAVTMLAIGFAESGLNERANNTSSIERSLGWAQINTNVHNVSDDCCYDVQCAANYAYQLYSGRGDRFIDWSTYNNGAYQAYMGQASAAFGGTGAVVTGGGSQSSQDNSGLWLLGLALVGFAIVWG